MKDGLSNDVVLGLLQDSRGFIWAGTIAGLDKFDGYQFTNFRHNPNDSSSLRSDVVLSLWEDQMQRLWVGTSAGLNLLDLKTEKILHLPLNSDNNSDIPIQKIRPRSNGTVWICTSKGVFLADPYTLSFTQPFEIEGRMNPVVALDIGETKDGSIWMSTGNGVVKGNVQTGEITRFTYDPNDPMSKMYQTLKAIYIDSSDRIWLGGAQSLDLFSPDNESFTHYIPTSNQLMPKFDIHLIDETGDGRILVGSGLGFHVFDPSSEQFNKIIDPTVWSFLRDDQQNLWIGTFSGLYQMAPKQNILRVLDKFDQTEVSDVRVTMEDNQGNIWIVTHNPNQLFRLDPVTWKFTKYMHDPSNPNSYSGYPVYGIIPSEDGGVWIASYRGLEKYNPENQSFSKINLDFIPVWILIDTNNTFWIVGYDEFGYYDFAAESFIPIDGYQRHVTCIAEDRHKNIWIGSWIGVYRYNLDTGEFKLFKNEPQEPQSLSHNAVGDITVDQQGTVWLGTLGGLTQIIPGTESGHPKFLNWNTQNSNLPSDQIGGVIDGLDGSLWLSSGNQISKFDIQLERFKNYDHHDGLNGQFVGGGLRGPTGEIYFSNRNGMVVFYPDSLKENTFVPPVVITEVTINNQQLTPTSNSIEFVSAKSPLKNSISYTDTIELTYKQRDFALEFAALNFLNPESNRYKYKLEPYEQEWIETSAENRIARYTNISPGKYVFKVVGSNNDGVWNENGQYLAITVHPPLWATWWAYVLYGLCAIGLVLILRHYEKKRFILKQKAKSLEEIDRIKSEFFTNISHELRTPLTLIMGPLKAMQEGSYKGDVESLLAMMSNNGNRLLRLVNQLLDLSKLDQGKQGLDLNNCNINQLVQEILANFEASCAAKNITLGFFENQTNIRTTLDREKIRQVLINLVDNAIKFTPGGGSVKVILNVIASWENHQTKFPSAVQIMVKDTGIGIPKSEHANIFNRFYQVNQMDQYESTGTGIGLALAKKLVNLHQGILAVESEPGKGATFTITLPMLSISNDLQSEGKTFLEDEKQEFAAKPEREPSIVVNSKSLTHASHQSQTSKYREVLLVVEDSTEMRQLIKLTMGQDYDYLEAANGIEGLKVAKEKIPDLIISDVMMPQMDGYGFCKEVLKYPVTAHIPFIFLTAKADNQSQIQGLETGSSDYLIKPFNVRELQLKVRNQLDRINQLKVSYSKQLTIQGDMEIVESLDQKFMKRAVSIVQEKIENQDFTVAELSRQVGMSHTQLYRKLMTLTGHSPSFFIRSIRLKKAAQLILQNYGNTSEVAYAVGFSNLSYFTKCFKEQFGVVPSNFAKNPANQAADP